jgi:hypothetical protein
MLLLFLGTGSGGHTAGYVSLISGGSHPQRLDIFEMRVWSKVVLDKIHSRTTWKPSSVLQRILNRLLLCRINGHSLHHFWRV